MRQVREILRFKHVAGHSERKIDAAIGISRYTVAEYLRRAAVVGTIWPVPAELNDKSLEARLFSPPFGIQESVSFASRAVDRPGPRYPDSAAATRRLS